MFSDTLFFNIRSLDSPLAGGVRKGVKWRWRNSCRIRPDIGRHTYAITGITSFVFRVGLAFTFGGILVIEVTCSCRRGIKTYFIGIGHDD